MSGFVAGVSQNLDALNEQLARRGQDGESASPPPSPNPTSASPRARTAVNTPGLPSSGVSPMHAKGVHLSRTVTTYDTGSDAPTPTKDSSAKKRGTFDGVFVPVCLNVCFKSAYNFIKIIGVIMFLRFGFILGQTGLLGALLLLCLGFLIDVFTATSVSAIATNGQVRGGGPYYMLSRSLGPEFGGSIGLCFVIAQIMNASMNVLGFVESFLDVFGEEKQGTAGIFPNLPWWIFLYASIILAICAIINLVGAQLFDRATRIVSFIVVVSILSIPISFFFKDPFQVPEARIYYTGPSLTTLSDNLFPRFTKHAEGSSTSTEDSFMTVFGVLFPALNGILSGASMSSSLRKPGKSISKGTFWALFTTGMIYVLVMIMMAASTPRITFYNDLGVMHDISIAPALINLGALASTFFSAMLGVTACSQVLQAIARDSLIPILNVFGKGSARSDNPYNGILLVWAVCQMMLFADNVNTIARLVTMFTMLVFLTINLACFVLRIAASQNFRPEFKFFSEWTALAGIALSICGMVVTDLSGAMVAVITCACLFAIIHYTSPPKSWGDVTQSLIYHQVRKYLLRLDQRKSNVKFWRPAILLLTNNTRKDLNLILAMNSLKKGGLFILGHILKGDFDELLPQLRKQHSDWLQLVDVANVKAFVDMTIAKNERDGARSIMVNAGLGSMRPNIVVIGFLDSIDWRNLPSKGTPSSKIKTPESPSEFRINMVDPLPTDDDRIETPINIQDYVGILEDTLALNKALAVAYRFQDLRLPERGRRHKRNSAEEHQWIDLWPLLGGNDGWSTYTMVLQLGTTLSFVPSWSHHKLRVTIYVEHPEEVQEEKRKMQLLLSNLRIPAALRIVVLASGFANTYEILVRGKEKTDERIEMALAADPWWEKVRRNRERKQKHPSRAPSPVDLSSPAHSPSRTIQKYSDSTKMPRPVMDLNRVINLLSRPSPTGRLRSSSVSYHPQAVTELPTPDDSDEEYVEDEENPSGEQNGLMSSLTNSSTGRAFGRLGRRFTTSETAQNSSNPTLNRSSIISTGRGYGATDIEVGEMMPSAIQGSDEESPRCDEVDEDRMRDSNTSFNDLPYRAQVVILNELFAQHSKEDTAIIITSLPQPDPGTSESFERSSSFLEHLGAFFNSLPPVLAVFSSEQTMTTAL